MLSRQALLDDPMWPVFHAVLARRAQETARRSQARILLIISTVFKALWMSFFGCRLPAANGKKLLKLKVQQQTEQVDLVLG